MAIYKSSNPALNDKTFTNLPADAPGEVMTINGTVNKIGLLFFIVIISAMWTWHVFSITQDPQSIMTYLGIGAIGGFIVALITIFNKRAAYISAPIYCCLEGFVLGGLSAITNAAYPGIAFEAMLLTFTILFCLLILYRFKIIKATENFKMIVFSATAGIAIFYLISMVIGFFGVNMPLIQDSGTAGIIFSIFVVIIASLNLVVDFDFIEQGAQSNAPKYMEWYAAFGLMVTLIWLYLEILRLISKGRRR